VLSEGHIGLWLQMVWLVNSELDSIRKEEAVTQFRELSQHLLERRGETVNPWEQLGCGPRTEPRASGAQSRGDSNRTSTFSLKCLVRRERKFTNTSFEIARCSLNHWGDVVTSLRFLLASLCTEASEQSAGQEFSPPAWWPTLTTDKPLLQRTLSLDCTGHGSLFYHSEAACHLAPYGHFASKA
jgi:hypothetical protein